MTTLDDRVATAQAAAAAAAASADTASTAAQFAADAIAGAVAEGVENALVNLDGRMAEQVNLPTSLTRGAVDLRVLAGTTEVHERIDALTHAELGGLGDDDHPQYHTDARGDARYYTKPVIDDALGGKSDTTHNHRVDQLLDPTAARSMNGQKIIGLANGTSAQDAITKAQLDGKILNCTSTTRPAHVEGRVIYETDTDRIYISDGAEWDELVQQTPWTNYSPWMGGFAATVSRARWTRHGNMVHAQVRFHNFTSVNGQDIRVGLPVVPKQGVGYTANTVGDILGPAYALHPTNGQRTTGVAFLYEGAGVGEGGTGSVGFTHSGAFQWTNVVPFGWSTGSVLSAELHYEV